MKPQASMRAVWLALALLGVACRSEPAPESPTLRIAFPTAPATLDPHLHNDNWTFSLLANIYDGLTAFDPHMTLQPALAESWHNPNELSWRFTLRPGVRFHDGRTLTIADVIASLERARSHPESLVSSFLVSVESISGLDERTVEIRTKRPYPLLANKLTFISIVPADAPERIDAPIGTGPFRFSSLQAETHLELTAFASAWSGAPRWGELRFEITPAPARRAELWRDGHVDMAFLLEPASAELLADRTHDLLWQDDSAIAFLGFRVDREPFDDARARRGLSLALNRKAAAARLEGWVAPVGQFVAPQIYGHDPRIDPIRHEPSTAKELLGASGLLGAEPLKLEVTGRRRLEAQVVAEQLAELGLEVEVVEMPWSDLYARLVAGETRFFIAGFRCTSGDASDLFDTALHTEDVEAGWGGSNLMRYSNERLDEILEEAGRSFDMPERRELFARAAELALEDLPLIPLWNSRELHAVSPELDWTPRADSRLLGAEVGISGPR